MASVGDVGQWMITERQKNSVFFITSIYDRFFNQALVKTFSGAVVLSLSGHYLNQWLGTNFDASAYLFVSVLSAIGAYIGLSRERTYRRTVGGLIGAAFGVYLINHHSIISIFNESVLIFTGKVIGALVGGMIGLGSGAIIAIVFCILTVYSLLGLYFLADRVADQIASEGYQKMFGVMVFIVTVIIGSWTKPLRGRFQDFSIA